MNMYVVWGIVIIAALFIEMCTSTLVSIWFVPAAAICILLNLFNLPVIGQIIAFLILAPLFIMLFYKKLRDNISSKSEKTNIDALIGKTAVVEEDIAPFKPGRVKVGGISWSAYCDENSREIKVGERVEILIIDGVKLKCIPTEIKAENTLNV